MMRTLGLGTLTLGSAALLTWFIDDDRIVGDVALLVATAVCLNFTFWYSARSRWKLLNAGRSLLYVFLALDLVLLQNSLSVWVGPEYFGRQILRAMMYTSIVVAVIGMSWTLWRILQREPTPIPEGTRYLDEIDLEKDHL